MPSGIFDFIDPLLTYFWANLRLSFDTTGACQEYVRQPEPFFLALVAVLMFVIESRKGRFRFGTAVMAGMTMLS
jgi:hypothetical protein